MKAERRKTLFIFKVYFIFPECSPSGGTGQDLPSVPSTHIHTTAQDPTDSCIFTNSFYVVMSSAILGISKQVKFIEA